MNTIKSYKSAKTETRESPIDKLGMFAKENIKKGEIILIKAGHIVKKEDLIKYKNVIRDSEMQITDDFYLAPLNDEEFHQTMGYLNHSCTPNGGVLGNIIFIAIRDIDIDEELTCDYCMHQSDKDYKMACTCNVANCRKIIFGNDWQRKNLQEKYGNYFSSYILEKIKNL